MSSSRLLIPASGTVRFIVWNYEGDDYMPKLFDIDGDTEWLRPVVGLLFAPPFDVRKRPEGGCKIIESDHPLRPFEGQSMDATPLVVDELGSVYKVHDYLEQLLGGDHWDHTAHFYEPHISGPVTNAPRFRYSLVGARRAGIRKRPKPEYLP